jgi:hypothetical protein
MGEAEKTRDLTIPLSWESLCDERGEVKGCVIIILMHRRFIRYSISEALSLPFGSGFLKNKKPRLERFPLMWCKAVYRIACDAPL